MPLQSMLCSSKLSPDVCSLILQALADCTELQGQASIWLLCQVKINPRSAIDQVIEEHPKILALFMQECFGDKAPEQVSNGIGASVTSIFCPQKNCSTYGGNLKLPSLFVKASTCI